MGLMRVLALIMVFLPLGMWGQYQTVTIGGNVYGGGNAGKVGGNTTVTVRAGDLNKVFAGARMADVGGRTFLNVDGEHASGDVFIVEAYGGNDIAGTIGKETTDVPAELTEVLRTGESEEDYPKKNKIGNDTKTFIRTTRSSQIVAEKVKEKNAIIIGKLFGGGNGDYDYQDVKNEPTAGQTTHKIFFRGEKDKVGATPIATTVTRTGEVGFNVPELPNTYLEILGGCISQTYGGGNNATITGKTTIFVDNKSETLGRMATDYAALSPSMTEKQIIDFLLNKVKVNTFQTDLGTYDFNMARVFGGNNKADMAIRPTWNLQSGKIRDLYSGGNRGRMTNEIGLRLVIDPLPLTGSDPNKKNDSTLVVDNVYGGCRMADVRPMEWLEDEINPETEEMGVFKDVEHISNEKDVADGYFFPPNFAAHTLILGGDINNVYGGNDIMGRVYFGNAVGVATSIRGNIYGGGNGSYAYTDNDDLENSEQYGDFYYNRQGSSAAERLLEIRPDAEQVSIVLRGTEGKPTYIGGSVFVGGNCATLNPNDDHKNLLHYPLADLKIGSYVYADKVYLGNNGEGMVSKKVLRQFLDDVPESSNPYNTMRLDQESGQMIAYMEGVAMSHIPTISLEDDERFPYQDYTSYIGSLFLGGNVGSMIYEGTDTMQFNFPITVFDKVVGGCNNANVPEQYDDKGKLNVRYEGGVLGSFGERYKDYQGTPAYYTENGEPTGTIKDRLVMNFEKLRIEPLRWKDPSDKTKGLEWNTVMLQNTYVAVPDGEKLTAGKKYYTSDAGAGEFTALGTETSDGSNYYTFERYVKTPNVVSGSVSVTATDDDKNRRLTGGNVYGGCYASGHVNGNVIINLNDSLHSRHKIFDKYIGEEDGEDVLYELEDYKITDRRSGVILDRQGMDVLGSALNVFGGGYGAETEIWGSTTINLKKGYTFQIFGGGDAGAIGRGTWNPSQQKYIYYGDGQDPTDGYDARYSTTVNLHGTRKGEPRSDDVKTTEAMAEAEFIYGGGFEGTITGDTRINLGNGRIFNSFAGSCNSDVFGHTETYLGIGGVNATTKAETVGFPWVRDYIYGGNDLGGIIWGKKNYIDRVRDADVKALIHNPKGDATPDVVQATTYVEYLQGHATGLYGGCFGDYDYEGEYKDYKPTYEENAFVNFRPVATPLNKSSVKEILGAGEGCSGFRGGDNTQDYSYVLIDIPKGMDNFQATEVFGAGSNNGVGMRYSANETREDDFDLDKASAIIDLLHGKIGSAYGGAYNEGVTRRTVVNVPENSTIDIGNIFGGAFGTQTLPPCDVYESHVNYRSEAATIRNAIYGGNNNERRTLYAHVNISAPVYNGSTDPVTGEPYMATVYGAGRGQNSWSEYTEVNLERGAKVFEVYGGSQNGHVVNTESIVKYMQNYWGDQGVGSVSDPKWLDAWTLGDYYKPDLDAPGGLFCDYLNNSYTNLNNSYTNTIDGPLVRTAEMDDRDYTAYTNEEKIKRQYKYNTNVIINEGALVANYAYGGGLGEEGSLAPGDVWGSTYIALLGGKVKKDIYAGGTVGSVSDFFGRAGAYDATKNPGGFTASANAYIKGGTCRNVYGGGWEGSVGLHDGPISASTALDLPGETHVVIGDLDGTSFTNGVPAIQRNAYGGGEGGAVYGSAHLTLNKGYVGYAYLNAGEKLDGETGQVVADAEAPGGYVEKIIDETYKSNLTNKYEYNENLLDAGCLFGGGYIDDSWVDKTYVTIYDGTVRNSTFGGGEIAAIGRGAINKSGSASNPVFTLAGLYRPGKTNIEMYGGHVLRNVYGGGRGYDNLNRHGTLNCDGFVFGQTEVHIHGGEVGTVAGLENGDGNVFGGGDIGFVYSAYEKSDGTFGRGVKAGKRYNQGLSPSDEGYNYQGYYYQHAWGDGDFDTKVVGHDDVLGKDITERIFTEDCKVLIEPQCKAKQNTSEFTGIHYKQGEQVSPGDYTWLEENDESEFAKIGPDHKVADEDGITFSRSYDQGAYVPINALNTLKNKNGDGAKWAQLDQSGIIIHNAVFAGGNTQPGSAATHVNTSSIFGNATASINDVYNRDLITLGTRNTGGLYGDGNMTFVDGYRELNITNYGTDYYSILSEISISDYYNAITERERAYYELKYTCQKECSDKEGTRYKPASGDGKVKASTITADDLLALFLVYNETTKTYESLKDANNKPYLKKNDKGEWIPNTDEGTGYWKESGVVTAYAGRLMNTIQRADLCGVWGSRMVMKGAPDRVPEEADFTNYTINRVREVSLNKVNSPADDKDPKDVMHGNYFGIYSVVNYLGALSSDKDFGDENDRTDKRTTDNVNTIEYQCAANGKTYGTEASFYDWKKEFWRERKRNNGNSHNKVALASGVYLEITTEESTGPDLYEKVWGPITGVVELDLINVAPGIGGGFVYAKNIHGKRRKTNRGSTTLTALNKGAVTHWDFEYDKEDLTEGYKIDIKDDMYKAEWQTSGNFVHSTQTIIDDCYNISNKYMTGYNKPDGVPAHYWYIKGSVYVYDQYISAYTGIPNAYSETAEIPLTITAASHGQMTLLNVQPNFYAYYSSLGEELETGKKVVINDKTYEKNDPISFWDYYLLTPSQRALFVPQTYVNCVTCMIDGKEYEAGTYILSEDDFTDYKKSTHTYTDAEGHTVQTPDKTDANDDYIFRPSNKMSHDTGYILTYDVDNPSIWDEWYTKENSSTQEKKNTAEYAALSSSDKLLYNNGPTYRLKGTTPMLLGQHSYEVGDIINQDIYDTYQDVKTHHSEAVPSTTDPKNPDYQATFQRAYIVTQQVNIPDDSGHTIHHNEGSTVPASEADLDNPSSPYKGKVAEAFVSTSTIQISKTEFIFINTPLSQDDIDSYKHDVDLQIVEQIASFTSVSDVTAENIAALSDADKKKITPLLKIKEEIDKSTVPAYYCTVDGKYGGNYYESGHNYRGLEAWSSMSESDRAKFTYNYDAFDLLIDPSYTNLNPTLVANKHQYDCEIDTSEGAPDPYDQARNNPAGYSLPTPVDYTATYNSDTNLDLGTGNDISVKRNGTDTSTSVIQKDDELSREVYESLTNEQRHYSAIIVKDGRQVEEGGNYMVYVVNEPFQIGSTPYAVGNVISAEAYDGLTDKDKITTLTFPSSKKNSIFYYCRENYTVGEPGKGVQVTNVYPSESYNESSTEKYNNGANVTTGVVINATDYGNLMNHNQQKDFTIHGISPTETSTLYVSRESDIYDLSKEKIITVVYQYDYDEVQANGTVTPVSERHVLNIHIQFKSGVPIVEEIKKPELILPGDLVNLKEPAVTPGAYELLGGGWELFETQSDAESHSNGIEYNPLYHPLYWYQHNWYVSYYAKTYLGRTYSNSVPVSVANYHDLDEVMNTPEHHMYVDHPDVIRPSKIYINDYSKEGRNGLDELKQLFELSLLDKNSYAYDEDSIFTAGPFEGHHLLNGHVKQAKNLEFFMRTDIERENVTEPNPEYNAETNPDVPKTITKPKHWTPIIGAGGQCFQGIVHGDGHTIRNLDNSLFGKLCGDVYNLGVMGSFQGAGIVDEGTGYVESCWVKTTADEALSPKPYAVFGNPSDNKGYQVVNSYFLDANKGLYEYDDASGTSGGERGKSTAKPEKAFYNGEVAFDLNSFYLSKRYYEGIGQGTGKKWKFLRANNDGTLPETAEDLYYPNAKTDASQTFAEFCDLGYVENRFADGDFRYAAGEIPEDADPRFMTEELTNPKTGAKYDTTYFAPIWPDDYLFFGQALTYGYMDGEEGRALIPHQEVPSVLNRSDGRVDKSETGNRVYRAPAYFRNSEMSTAYFNPNAHLAQKSADGTKEAYPYMTAIDFADHHYGAYETYKTYGRGEKDVTVNGNTTKAFYPPLLVDDGLSGIHNWDETRNLLVYAPAATASGGGYANESTFNVLTDYFKDPAYSYYYDETSPLYTDSKLYRRVAEATAYDIYGHLVQSDLMATNDHLLVDKEDFDCPISYTFDGDWRMWYQRWPDNYVEPVWTAGDDPVRSSTQGWESVSLPFSAELVTTHQKGEITHFYGGSDEMEESKNGTHSKVGHEYWLREYNDIKPDASPAALANFLYPTALGQDKTVNNTFLWDHYYENTVLHKRKDANYDDYQEYYRKPRTHRGYSRLGADTPYLIGFPSETYYEFDLSGNFEAQNTAVRIPKEEVQKQIITFVSDRGETIEVSDLTKEGVKKGDYSYRPNYLNIDLSTTDYELNNRGVSYDQVEAEGGAGVEGGATAVPFRPFFRKSGGGGVREYRQIFFSNETSHLFGEDDDLGISGQLYIRARRGKILVTSTLEAARDVLIVNVAGATIDRYTIQPGETIETPIHTPGVYIVNKKKLSVSAR